MHICGLLEVILQGSGSAPPVPPCTKAVLLLGCCPPTASSMTPDILACLLNDLASNGPSGRRHSQVSPDCTGNQATTSGDKAEYHRCRESNNSPIAKWNCKWRSPRRLTDSPLSYNSWSTIWRGWLSPRPATTSSCTTAVHVICSYVLLAWPHQRNSRESPVSAAHSWYSVISISRTTQLPMLCLGAGTGRIHGVSSDGQSGSLGLHGRVERLEGGGVPECKRLFTDFSSYI
ncbi:hypothetical protein L3Q82_016238 [Scortum barcoo]|uniref:Uncharacterized protein n=1 Tax=Scortum barcoo TaxID=214431 RepID=A0ACB8VTJ9_9TELE|nr:hypothetical protein L3Q82_016238 [Scortum barcoo]